MSNTNTPLNADVETFNDNLAKTQHRIDIVSYYNKALSELFEIDSEMYKKDFASQFLSWVDTPNEFCIPHTELSNYGVLSDKIKDKDSSRAKKFFNDTHSYVEGVDYIVVEETIVNNGLKGQRIKKTYMMTPDVFKMCLMRCKNTRKYADYYLILEKVFVYYHRYEKAYLNFLCSGKDDKIDKLTQKVDEQARKAEEDRVKAEEDRMRDRAKAEEDRINSDKQIEKLLKLANLTLEQLDDARDDRDQVKNQLDELKEQNEIILDHVEDIKEGFLETASHSIVPFKDLNERSEFILFQNNKNPSEYKFMRGVKSYNEPRIKDVFDGDYKIIRREYDANPVNLFRTVRDSARKEHVEARKLDKSALLKIKIRNTTIELCNSYTHDEFVDFIERVYQDKFSCYKTKTAVVDTTA
jgi:hypothetical protein